MNLDLATLKNDEEVVAIMTMSERQIEALGFTEHSKRHSSIVGKFYLRSENSKTAFALPRLLVICTISATASTVPITRRAGRFSPIKF